MDQLKFIYNSPFKDSHSDPIHTSFPISASNEIDDLVKLPTITSFSEGLYRNFEVNEHHLFKCFTEEFHTRPYGHAKNVCLE